MNQYLHISKEIKDALEKNKPIIALESTIISHGMPYPENVETALKAEAIIRSEGAIPATIAILDGQIIVGLSHEQIDILGQRGQKVHKTSTNNLAYVISQKLDGATTVATTMLIAKLAGIRLFATGGIGGVHRGAETTFDISNDLEQLAKTSVAVVCAGAKSILDLEKTMEYLETKGVPLVGYKTDVLPAFYTSKSPYNVPLRLDTPKEIASMLHTKWSLGLEGGVVIANPIPKEYEVEESFINEIIDKALVEMDELQIKGKATTPFLLAKVASLTKGISLKANIQLYFNNCMLAAKIAKDLANE